MKIIEEGDGEDWSLQIKCEVVKDQYGLTRDSDKYHCGSLLEINKSDIKAIRWSKYLMGLDGTDYIVICPKCACQLYIPPEKIPGYIRFGALKEYDDKQRKDDKKCY